ncbi:hypothetical protein HK103_000805 [Boothiomyces macroporosus]|uniref:Nitrate/nitrite transporter n=1 Tax=Boothiomyces macroporosus TaxID=261099 RepID=A0AAD5UEU4_9FUNG|nr:hypothetical protein HK103_000805 [Boothiomyces macroporosus]
MAETFTCRGWDSLSLSFPGLRSLLCPTDIANSNILGLTSTLLVRAFTGILCDRYGPRKVMAGLLFAGAIPTALAGTVHDATGLIILRFFIGVLGGTFVPCQVWVTTFFDKSVVGTANALAGGWGNAGGGVVFFVMPAVVNSLVQNNHLAISTAWRLAFLVVPFVVITATAIAVLVFGDDCPHGKWSERVFTQEVIVSEEKESKDTLESPLDHGVAILRVSSDANLTALAESDSGSNGINGSLSRTSSATQIQREFSPVLKAAFSLDTLLAALPYACTFGAELALEGILSAWYQQQSKQSGLNWGETVAGPYAAIFGLLNIFTRPLGGIIADIIYCRTQTAVSKKWWMIFLGVFEGVLLVIIGLFPNIHVLGLFGLFVCLAVMMEAGNGSNYALVPHLNPAHNGVVSGMVGASGNLGGIIFGLVYRFNGTNYFKGTLINGIIVLSFHLLVCWIPVRDRLVKSF